MEMLGAGMAIEAISLQRPLELALFAVLAVAGILAQARLTVGIRRRTRRPGLQKRG